MPANLPPQYFEAEKRIRSARELEEKIAALQAMLAIMPRHKGTDKLLSIFEPPPIYVIFSLSERPPTRQFPSPYNGDVFSIIQVNNHSAIIISQHILF